MNIKGVLSPCYKITMITFIPIISVKGLDMSIKGFFLCSGETAKFTIISFKLLWCMNSFGEIQLNL